jgi:transcriptional regulator with XRE-family HTH domain
MIEYSFKGNSVQGVDSVEVGGCIPEGYTRQVRTVGQNIARIRERLGLSQVDLADRLKMRQPSVWKLENNKGLPHGATLFKVANGLRCTVEDLLCGVDEQYDKAIRLKMEELRDTLERMGEPVDPSDTEFYDNSDRLFDAQTVQRVIDEIVRDRDLASRAGALREAAAAFTQVQEDGRTPVPSVQPEQAPRIDAKDRPVSSDAATITETVYELRALIDEVRTVAPAVFELRELANQFRRATSAALLQAARRQTAGARAPAALKRQGARKRSR